MKFVYVFAILAVFAAVATSDWTSPIKITSTNVKPLSPRVYKMKDNPVLVAITEKLQRGLETKENTAVVNDYVDKLLVEVDRFMVQHGYDPLNVPDIHAEFEYKPLLITYHGELDLTNGWLSDTSTLHRDGDAIINYENYLLNIRIPLGFHNLLFNFDYSAKLMDLGPTGTIDGKVENVQIYADVVLDLKLLELVVQEFHIEDTGKISLKFHGNALIDWLTNLLTSVITTLLHDTVINVVDGKFQDLLADIVQMINELLQNMFN